MAERVDMNAQEAFDRVDRAKDQSTILVVDDAVSSAQLLKLQLDRAGYEVELAHSGEAALSMIEAKSPDLIILDVMMPGLDGFSVCRRLKADESTWFIPVILLTALSRIRDRIQGIEAGADDFLSKPFNREELLARVRSLLRLKAAYDALQTERNRLALLYSISQEINSRLALDEVLGKIVTMTREALQASMCSIMTFDEMQGMAQQIMARKGHPPSGVTPVTSTVLDVGLGGWVFRHRKGTIVHDASQDHRWLILPGDTEQVGSAIAAPLMVGAEVTGVLLLTHADAGYFDNSHLTVLTSIAAQAAVTVRNAHLYEVEQQRRQELELLQEAGVSVSAELNRKALTRLIVHQAANLIDAAAASLMLPNEAESHLRVEALWGLSEAYRRDERVPLQHVEALLRKGTRSFQITDLHQQSMGQSDLVLREGLISQLSLVLVASGRFTGLLNLYDKDKPRRFSSHEVKVAETFAQQAAIALANARLLERTREERGKLSAVLSSTMDAVVAIDEGGNLILANPAAERTFGLNAAEALGEPLDGKVPLEFMAVFDQVATDGESASAEILTERGSTLHVSVSPVAGVGQVAVVQDITLLKELEVMRLRAEQEERMRIRRLFERYVGPELVDRILAQEAGILERRERRDVVVLFTDLRGFTHLTATFPAHAVIGLLNEFFTAVVEVVHTHEGTVFDLAGDELMVGFGAPVVQEDAVERALHTAGEMQKVFANLSRSWRKEQGIEVGLGVGIDLGTVVMGSIGAPSHMNFALVGDAVNTAHHLVELAQHGEILVSEAVVDSLDAQLPGWVFERSSLVEVKGKIEPVKIYLARRQP